MSSGFIHVAASDRLSPFLKCITKFLDRFICRSTFGLFWPLAAVNNTSVNSGVFVSVWIPAVIFFGCRPWSTIAGWHGNSIFNFSRKKLKLFLILHTVFCNGRAVSITTHVYRIQSLHPSHTHFLFWDSGHPLWGEGLLLEGALVYFTWMTQIRRRCMEAAMPHTAGDSKERSASNHVCSVLGWGHRWKLCLWLKGPGPSQRTVGRDRGLSVRLANQ